MADIADIAQLFIPEVNTDEISKQFLKKSREECIDCDEQIPLARQKMGGVIRCVDCQLDHEKYSKRK